VTYHSGLHYAQTRSALTEIRLRFHVCVFVCARARVCGGVLGLLIVQNNSERIAMTDTLNHLFIKQVSLWSLWMLQEFQFLIACPEYY